MKKTFTLIFAVCIAFAVGAQTTGAKAKVAEKPVIAAVATTTAAQPTTTTAQPTATTAAPADDMLLVLKETEFNFGKIPQGKPVNHIFFVDNKGKDSLKIVNVQASCGCTTPNWEKDKAIAPGGSTQITVGYNAAAEGAFTKFITITYNGTQSKQITISGEVWKTPATSAPENKSLNDLKN